MYLLPKPANRFNRALRLVKQWLLVSQHRYLLASILDVMLIVAITAYGLGPAKRLAGPLISPMMSLASLTESKPVREIFGFAPYFTFDKLSNVDFNVLTTFAYFGIEVDESGNLIKEGPGFETFISPKATDIFKKAHYSGTRVVLTLTQMDNSSILSLMDDSVSQDRTVNQAVELVKNRGIDGLNIDFEFSGNPGQEFRDKFSYFIAKLADKMHSEVPSSKVTVSVYASSVKEPKIYDVERLAQVSDGIFMMAYDFAVANSKNAIPTAPLYGKNTDRGYWYDVASAVDDFLKLMPSEKLILGVPYYGYNHLVYTPEVKAQTRPFYSWRGRPKAQTYSIVQDDIKPDMEGIDDYREGRDPDSQVPYKAYHVIATDTWRIVFADDKKSLGLKYDFAKSKNLQGVGMWALGFDDGKVELWDLLAEKFGSKLAVNNNAHRSVR